MVIKMARENDAWHLSFLGQTGHGIYSLSAGILKIHPNVLKRPVQCYGMLFVPGPLRHSHMMALYK